MSDSPTVRPSFEQLQKQAKELLKQHRAGDAGAIERLSDSKHKPPALSDAQFAVAREQGFPSWAKLKHHIETEGYLPPHHFEQLAQDAAKAYVAADAEAIREMNFTRGTGLFHDREARRMHERLPKWFAAADRTFDLALEDARKLVARMYGFDDWLSLMNRVSLAPAVKTSGPPAFTIDWKEHCIHPGAVLGDRDWEAVFAGMKEHRIPAFQANGRMTDAVLERLSRLDHVTRVGFDGCVRLTDEGLMALARMPQLEEVDISGWKGSITDKGLEFLRHLPKLKRFQICWQQHITDAGLSLLGHCPELENVNLLGTNSGDGTVGALAGKVKLRHLKTGAEVTDRGLELLEQIPGFREASGDEPQFDLMSFEPNGTHVLLDGPFTNQGLRHLRKLEGLFGTGFFWHCPNVTSDSLAALADIPNLGFLSCGGELCDDTAMTHIGAMPKLRMLMGQGTVASDDGFAALSRSRTLEYLWGRECPNLGSRGFESLSRMPVLKGLAVSCRNVDDQMLALLPGFPALEQLMPMDVTDDGFRHVGRCAQLESLWCMYCRDTGDVAASHLPGLEKLKLYYAGSTQITDFGLEMVSRIQSLERVELWQCTGVTDRGVAHLATLPHLLEIQLDGLPGVTRKTMALFPNAVRVRYS